jgi:retron-type reverse transcriptase
MIEGDIKGYFNNIDQKIMMKLLKERIGIDRTLEGLIQKMFKAGYVENDKYKYSVVGVPQGGVISPILSNLYLTPFDEFMEQLKNKYTKLPISIRNTEYRHLESKIVASRRKLIR